MNTDERDPLDDLTPGKLIQHAREMKHFSDWVTSLTVIQREEMRSLYAELSKVRGRTLTSIARTMRHCAERRGYVKPANDPPADDEHDIMVEALALWKKKMEAKVKDQGARPDDPDVDLDDLGDDG